MTVLREHELRRQIVREMHLRRFPEFELPAAITQWVMLVGEEDRAAESAHLAVMPARTVEAATDHRRHASGTTPAGDHIIWERHSEASVTTLIRHGRPRWADDPSPGRSGIVGWAEQMPGRVIQATRILVVADSESATPLLAEAGFLEADMVSCHVAGGARIWTDYRIHDDGYGRMLVAANGLLPGDLARCVQRLQELGNYRNLAYMGLPLAQEKWAKLDSLERELDSAGRAQSAPEMRDDDLLLHLSGIAGELLTVTSQSGYRMSATAAYAEIVSTRMNELRVEPIVGYQSLVDFTNRRFKPAVRTCATLMARLEVLNRRAENFTAMLRTRVDTRIENQNARLLASLDKSARTQLRLQHLVEGLSTVAISYYALNLLSYPLKSIEYRWPALHHYDLMAILMPVVVIGVFLFMKTIRHRITTRD